MYYVYMCRVSAYVCVTGVHLLTFYFCYFIVKTVVVLHNLHMGSMFVCSCNHRSFFRLGLNLKCSFHLAKIPPDDA